LKERNLREVIGQAYRHGFQVVEIWTDHIKRSGLAPAELLQLLRDSGLAWTVHAAMRDLNLISGNEGIQRESLRQVEEAVRLAAAIGAGIITVHPGRKSSRNDRKEDLWLRLVEVFRHLAQLAREEGLILCVENMEYSPMELVVDLEDVERLFYEVGEPNFGVTLDLAHLHRNPQAQEVVRKAPGVANVHLSDASSDSTHLLLGKGELDYMAMLKPLRQRYDGSVILEGYTPGAGVECLEYLFLKWQEAVELL